MRTTTRPETNPLHGLTVGADADDLRRPELGRLSDQRLVECAAEVIGVPRASVAGDRHSFVLHAPLELMARSALLPHVAPVGRDEARSRIVALAAGYQSSGPPVPDPPAGSFDSPSRAASALLEGIAGQDLDGADVAACWLGPRLRTDQVVALLADRIVDLLSAAGHGNIYLQLLARNHPRGLPDQMLRPLARALAVASDHRIDVPDDRVSAEHGRSSTEALLDVLTRVPVIGPANHDGIAALVEHAQAGQALRDLVDADGWFTSPRETPFELLRFAAQAMLQGPAESSPYGWTHCLTLSQAALLVGEACERPSRATYVGAAYLAAHWATLGKGTVDLDRVPDPVDIGLREALATSPGLAAAAAWHDPARAETLTVLATAASSAHDAHRVKYTLACLDAVAADPSHRPLYLAAAAYLNAWWVRHPDPSDPLATMTAQTGAS